MSGICGWVEPGSRTGDTSSGEMEVGLQAMLRAASHRGPDGHGIWSEPGGALGHLALRLTPESVHEEQPLVDPDAGLVLVADVRLDNREELLRILEPPPLSSRREAATEDPSPVTDAALLLAAYRRWGPDSPKQLIGDFAFAVWESRTRRLFAARDAMGMRSVYFLQKGGGLLFASEVQQLLAVPDVHAELFRPAVGGYLAGGLGRPEWTFYRGIRQLPPAHAILATGSELRQWRFWQADPDQRIRHRRAADYTLQFREVMQAAVKARLRSRRSVGLLLSGGVDSSTIAIAGAEVAQPGGGVGTPRLRAYSHAFQELTDSDERHISQPLAERLGLPVTDVPSDDCWPLKDHPCHGPHRDEPWTEVYQAMLERSFRAAGREGMGVLLTGHRGDEMVGDWIYDVPGLMRSGDLGAVWREATAYRAQGRGSGARFLRRELLAPFLAGQGSSAAPTAAPPPWLASELEATIDLAELREEAAPSGPFEGARAARHGRIFRLGGARAALHHRRTALHAGLEHADPWSDRRIAEFVLAIPQHLVNRISEPKRLARQAMSDVISPAFTRKTEKIIPSGLFHRGFREREVASVHDLMKNSRAAEAGFLEAQEVTRIYKTYLDGQAPPHDFWWPLTLEMWLRAHWP
jgi:asparagine synthase (glutamine-hydrolysing)